MPKFSAKSAADFRTLEAAKGRFLRGAKCVVIVEADDGSWCELDADNVAHGRALAQNWVDPARGNARGASVWRVKQDGNLRRFADALIWHNPIVDDEDDGWCDDGQGPREDYSCGPAELEPEL